MPELLAGAGQVEITPATPQWLDGYGTRSARSEGAYQPIWAKALLLRQGPAQALIVSAEVLGFDRARVAALKNRISQRTGVPAEAVVLCATHTHCAPRVCDMIMPGELDPDYRKWFEERCVIAAERACAGPVPVRLARSQAHDSLGTNRRHETPNGVTMAPNPDGPRDAVIESIWFESASGTLASFTSAATHPTCRGGQQVGGDYPGFLCRELEGALGGVALFGLGCAGDVRPNFTGPTGGFRMAELEEVRSAGQAMAAAVLRGRERRDEVAEPDLAVARSVVEMPLAEVPTTESLRESISDGSPLKRRWAAEMLARPRDGVERTVTFELHAVRLARGLRLLFWPGEVVCDYGLWIKSSRQGRVIPIAYSNGAVGYVPSASIYPLGGYEVNGSHHLYHLPAPYAPEVDEHLKSATVDLLATIS